MSISDDDLVLQELMNKLAFVAMEDGNISKDELAILKQVKFDINSFRERINEIKTSESTSTKEVDHLEEFSKDIIQNAYKITKSDHVITTDERAIINTLIKALIH